MNRLWSDRRVVISVGTGGVGKTTVSACLALAAAAEGKRVLVMTIDPSRRLAHALGIEGHGNIERSLSVAELQKYGIEVQQPLWAMVPDVKGTFDKLVERFAPDESRRQAIYRNPIYQRFSTVLAGSLEYAAVEKLYEVYSSGRYDLIVLDTPPSQNALDFLDAPSRIVDFLEHDALQWLNRPGSAGRFGAKLLGFGSSFIAKTLGRLTGADTLRELGDFIASFQGMYDGFRERSNAVRTLLGSDEVAFVLVGTSARTQIDAMSGFRRALHREGLKVRAVVLNRTRALIAHPSALEAGTDELRDVLSAMGVEAQAASDILDAAEEELELARRDRAARAEVTSEMSEATVVELPELTSDVRDLNGLASLYRAFIPSH